MRKGLEKIVEKGKKSLKKLIGASMLAGALGFGNSFGVNDANAQTVGAIDVWVEAVDKQTGTASKRELVAGREYYLKLMADNRGLNGQGTYKFAWKSILPAPQDKVELVDIPQPNPHYSGYLGPDFFEGFRMDSLINNSRIGHSERIIRNRDNGPTNRIGTLGAYQVNIKSDARGMAIFKIREVVAVKDRTSTGTPIQPTNLKNPFFVVVNEPRTAPVIAIDKNRNLNGYNIYVAEMPEKKSVVEYSTNWIEWTSIYTNNFSGKSFEIFDQHDKNVPLKMYRTRVLE